MVDTVLHSNEDTIAAVSTAYGEGGIGIVRISGPAALGILQRLFVAELPAGSNTASPSFANRKLYHGYIVDPEDGRLVDEVLAVYMHEPHTYTCEDVVEIDGHGSVAALREILALVLRAGARAAEPGEFTRRAFLGGRIDLSQAEAVIDLIEAETEAARKSAADQLSGHLSARIRTLRQSLLDLLVNMAVNIDYPDEDIEPVVYEDLAASLRIHLEEVEHLRDTGATGRLLKDGLRIAIVGKPNVGKSSLLNALMGEARAIVTEVPGTTRDTISETIDLGGYPVRLIDTAGIRDTEDVIEKMGIDRSREAVSKADLILFVLDGSAPLAEEDRHIAALLTETAPKTPLLVLLNKQDLGEAVSASDIQSLFMPRAQRAAAEDGGYAAPAADDRPSGSETLEIWNTSLIGDMTYAVPERLLGFLQERIFAGDTKQKEPVVITSARHEGLLSRAAEALSEALSHTVEGEALDLIEIDVREAYEALGEILGEAVTGEILEEVFARFCLGK